MSRALVAALVAVAALAGGCATLPFGGQQRAEARRAEAEQRIFELERQAVKSRLELERLEKRLAEIEARAGGSRPAAEVPAPATHAASHRRRRWPWITALIIVIVAETGWPGKGQPVARAVPSAENAMRYFIDVQQWARREGVKLFYFSSFDEPWKLRQEGEVGTQWGLWDKDERPKYGV